jgi:hypothetical protein
MPGDACPAGWHVFEPARGRLLKATSAFDEVGVTVGAALSESAPPTHAHTFSTQISIGATGIAGATGCCTGGPGAAGAYPLTGATAAATDGMPVVFEVLCEVDAPAAAVDGHPYPAGAITFFNRETCPPGFDNVPEADGRFLVGTPLGGNPGVVVGSALSSGASVVHAHALGASIDVAQKSLAAAGGGNKELAAKGLHSFSVLSAQTDASWPYIQLLLCRAQSAAAPPPAALVDDSALASGALGWFETPDCPAGWSPTPDHPGRLSAGLAAGAAPASVGAPLAPGESRTHSHAFSGSFTLPERQVALLAGCCNNSPGGKGTYSYSGTTDAAASGLPYLTLTACARD